MRNFRDYMYLVFGLVLIVTGGCATSGGCASTGGCGAEENAPVGEAAVGEAPVGGAARKSVKISASGAVGTSVGNVDTAGAHVEKSDTVQPMPVISRNVPSFASGGWPQNANDNAYETFFLSESGLPAWLVYDLSKVPALQRGRVVVHWINDSYNYSAEMAQVIRAPGRYTIDAHAAPGGSKPPKPDDAGWVTLVNIDDPPNVFHSRQHVVNLTDGKTVYNWIRLYVTETTGGEAFRNWDISINMDVHDARLGVKDSWLFSGDSITNGGMLQAEFGDENFAKIIHRAMPEFFPVQENCGVGGWRAEDGAAHVPIWLDHFPGRYVALSYGTNDSGAATPVEKFYASYEIMVKAVLNAGKIPIVPTIPWFRRKDNVHVPALNQTIAKLKKAYPEIVDGPDFWTFFVAHKELISDDNIHPSAEGYRAYRRLWAEKMLEEVYRHKKD